eukprot:Skav218768  [mRNA]  locus=scaffold1372:272552:273475:- [translate_table: standard]
MSKTDLPLSLPAANSDGSRSLVKANLSSDVPSRAQFSSLSEDLPPLDLGDLDVLATMSLPADFFGRSGRAPLQRRRGQFRKDSKPLVLEKSEVRGRECRDAAEIFALFFSNASPDPESETKRSSSSSHR